MDSTLCACLCSTWIRSSINLLECSNPSIRSIIWILRMISLAMMKMMIFSRCKNSRKALQAARDAWRNAQIKSDWQRWKNVKQQLTDSLFFKWWLLVRFLWLGSSLESYLISAIFGAGMARALHFCICI